jgi:hypothetical protein
LAILVLELEDMVVQLASPPKLAGVHGDRWTVRLPGQAVDVRSQGKVDLDGGRVKGLHALTASQGSS